jgi:hypothetical protein
MPRGEGVFRTVLGQLRHIVNRYEELGLVEPQAAQAARYQLAVEATELNGDACRFPACDCPKADCANRPRLESMTAPGTIRGPSRDGDAREGSPRLS